MRNEYIFDFIIDRTLEKFPEGKVDKNEFRKWLGGRYFNRSIAIRMIEDMIRLDLICLEGKGGRYIIIKKHRPC